MRLRVSRGDFPNDTGRWLVRHEMPNELEGDVSCGRWMTGEVAKHGAPLFLAVLGIGQSHHRMVARLVGIGTEDETAHRPGTFFIAIDGPAGDDAGKRRDVRLIVAAIHSQRVQLHDLAGEVLVEPTFSVLVALRVRADRLMVVEEIQHSRVTLDRKQHVFEAAENMRAYSLAFKGAGHDVHVAALAGSDCEMVGPKHREAFAETDQWLVYRAVEPGVGLGNEDLLRKIGAL